MATMVEKVKEEIRKVFVIGVFFAVGFCLIDLSDRLLTRGSGIQIASFATAIIGGLVVAKVLLIVDVFPFVHAFPAKPLIHNIIWKSSLYIGASIVFRYIEPLLKNLFRGMSFAAAQHSAIREVMSPRF